MKLTYLWSKLSVVLEAMGSCDLISSKYPDVMIGIIRLA